jgi:hypothetical protein
MISTIFLKRAFIFKNVSTSHAFEMISPVGEIFCGNGMTVSKRKSITLLPVLRPSFNAREMCKELVLLEKHLNEPLQRCKDCISKHFLTIEALAEEAISLHCPEKKKLCPKQLHGIPHAMRRLQSELAASAYSTDKCTNTAAALRKVRKSLMRDHAVIPLSQLPPRTPIKRKRRVRKRRVSKVGR